MRRKQQAQNANNEEGIPIKPIKHKRAGSDKTREVEEQMTNEDSPKRKPPPARRPHPAETAKKTNTKSTVDLDKGNGRGMHLYRRYHACPSANHET